MARPGVFPRRDSLGRRIIHGRIFPFDRQPRFGGIPATGLSNQTDVGCCQVSDAVAFDPEKGNIDISPYLISDSL